MRIGCIRFLDPLHAHFSGWQNTEEMNGRPFCRSQIFLVLARIKNRRQAVVNGLYEFVWLPGDHGEGSFPMICLWVSPGLLNAGDSEGFPAWDHNFVLGLLPSPLNLLPFEDGVGGNNAAPLLKRVLPELCLVDAF